MINSKDFFMLLLAAAFGVEATFTIRVLKNATQEYRSFSISSFLIIFYKEVLKVILEWVAFFLIVVAFWDYSPDIIISKGLDPAKSQIAIVIILLFNFLVIFKIWRESIKQ